MLEPPVSALDDRHQKIVTNIRRALERGELDYAVDAAAEILAAVPGCVEVRRLQRAAQLRRVADHRSFAARMLRRLGAARFASLMSRASPGRRFRAAETRLAADPTSATALRRLAETAQALGLHETAVFAWDEICALTPHALVPRVALGSALLAAGRPEQARRLAEQLLERAPHDAPAHDLLRRASVAETLAGGHWDSPASFREKLKRPS